MKRKLTRREFIRGAAVASVGLVAAACAPAVAPTTAPAPAPTTAPAAPVAPAVTVPAVRKPITIQWMLWGGADRYKPLVEAYKKNYPETASWLTVELVSPGSGELDSYKALRLAMAAGGEGLPEMCAFNYNGVPEFQLAGALADTSQVLAPYLPTMSQNATKLAQYQGKYCNVPNQIKAKLWFYRKDMFDQAAIDPTTVKTFDDLIAAAKKFHAKFPNGFLLNQGLKPATYNFCMWLSHWDDVAIADAQGNFQISKNPRFADFWKWMKALHASDVGYNTDDFSTDWGPAFADNKIGSSLIATWMMGFLPSYAPKQKDLWGMTAWPDFCRTGTDNGGQVQAILKKSKNPEAGLELARLMFLETPGAVSYWNFNGSAPVTKAGQDAVSALTANATRPAGITDDQWAVTPVNFFGKDFMTPVYKALDTVKVFPWDPKGNAEIAILQNHLYAYMADQETLEQSLSKCDADLKSQVGNPWA